MGKIKRILLMVFFSVHLLLILFQAIWTTIEGYWIFHFDKTPAVPSLNILRQNRFNEPYYIFSGTNTGYGFYGIKTSTAKYLRVTYLDSLDHVLQRDRYFNLSTSNGISRLESSASYLSNYIADTDKLMKRDTLFPKKYEDIVSFRREYITKVFDWLGRARASSIPGCVSYRTELLTIVPPDTSTQTLKSKPQLYVIQESLFPTR